MTPGLHRHYGNTYVDQSNSILSQITLVQNILKKQHADHLATNLKKYHNITEDWEGTEYAGIDSLAHKGWVYFETCRVC